jgi:hypothetical protein
LGKKVYNNREKEWLVLLKMFATQLSGVFKRLEEKEEFAFEDGARLLAQAPAGDGKIYIYGLKEMKAVAAEALEGAEPLKWAQELTEVSELTEADRVLLFTRFADDAEAFTLAGELQKKGIPFVAVSTVRDEASKGLANLADVHIDLGLKKGLLPDEFGGRFGLPSSIAGLYVYYGLRFVIDEMMAEYEEE